VNIVLFLAQQKLLALLDGMYRKFLENVSRLLFRHLFISLEKSKNPCNITWMVDLPIDRYKCLWINLRKS
jgi:hypothetical protein